MSCVYFAAINIPPETKYANISDNMTVTFYCKATGERTEWVIQNMRYSSQNQTIDGYIMREVKEGGTSMIVVHHMYLEVPATVEYNRTTVRCGVSVNQQLIFSDPVMLILQGKFFIHKLEHMKHLKSVIKFRKLYD